MNRYYNALCIFSVQFAPWWAQVLMSEIVWQIIWRCSWCWEDGEDFSLWRQCRSSQLEERGGQSSAKPRAASDNQQLGDLPPSQCGKGHVKSSFLPSAFTTSPDLTSPSIRPDTAQAPSIRPGHRLGSDSLFFCLFHLFCPSSVYWSMTMSWSSAHRFPYDELAP